MSSSVLVFPAPAAAPSFSHTGRVGTGMRLAPALAEQPRGTGPILRELSGFTFALIHFLFVRAVVLVRSSLAT